MRRSEKLEAAAEHPTPERMRASHINLNGDWHFAFDDKDVGIQEGWWKRTSLDSFNRKIRVPYAFQTEASGLNLPEEIHEVVWYARELPDLDAAEEYLLHFNAVDYHATVYVNGQMVGDHTGGYCPFSFPIKYLLNEGSKNIVTVRVFDSFTDMNQPRGKQYWKTKPEAIWYTATTGIWQTVWLEPVPKTRIDASSLRITSNIDDCTFGVDAKYTGPDKDVQLDVEISCCDHFIARSTFDSSYNNVSASISVKRTDLRAVREVITASADSAPAVPHWLEAEPYHAFLWSPESPVLYDFTLRLVSKTSGKVIDELMTYSGLRKVSVDHHGKWCLNNKPYFQRLVLDQGYWPKSGLTATSEELKRDVELGKELGFNGCRKHQKLEAPAFLFWADHLGYLVWSEYGSSHEYTTDLAARFIPEWTTAVLRDILHPCIVAYVPVNESWGVEGLLHDQRQVQFLETLYNSTKALTNGAHVSTNDGWEQPSTDILGFHDYGPSEELKARWTHLDDLLAAPRTKILPGYKYASQPIMCTEYGGTFLTVGKDGSFSKEGLENLRKEAHSRTKALCDSKLVQGFVYTELADCQQEQNGFLTANRKHKLDPTIVHGIITQESRLMPGKPTVYTPRQQQY